MVTGKASSPESEWSKQLIKLSAAQKRERNAAKATAGAPKSQLKSVGISL